MSMRVRVWFFSSAVATTSVERRMCGYTVHIVYECIVHIVWGYTMHIVYECIYSAQV
jgi:hypothetical protein